MRSNKGMWKAIFAVVGVLAVLAVTAGADDWEFKVFEMTGEVAAPQAIDTVLRWDDGSIEGALGPLQAGQFAVRFGGASNTSDALPFKVEAAQWAIAGVASNAGLGFWNNPGNSPAFVVFPVTGASGVQTHFFDGPTVGATPILAGFMGAGRQWGIAVDLDGTAFGRNFFGPVPGGSLPGGPTTMNQICSRTLDSQCNWIFRLGVDANIPVELESFEID